MQANDETTPAAKRQRVEPPVEERAHMREVAGKIKQEAPMLWASLREFEPELLATSGAAYESNRAYLRHVESLVLIKAMKITLMCGLFDSNCRADKVTADRAAEPTGWRSWSSGEVTLEDRQALATRCEMLSQLEEAVEAWRATRLLATDPTPRLVRLAEHYGFDNPRCVGARILEVLAVLGTAQSDAVRCALVEDEPGRRASQLCRVAAVSELEVEAFADADEEHVKENVVYVSDDGETYSTAGGVPPLRLSRICARVVLGEHVGPEDLLKTSGTALEAVLAQEGLVDFDDDAPPSAKKQRGDDAPPSKLEGEDDDPQSRSSTSSQQDIVDKETSLAIAPSAAATSTEVALASAAPVVAAREAPLPYPADNELEYLSEMFELIALHIRLATAKIKGAIKEQSGSAPARPWFPPAADEGSRAGARELKAKVRVAEARIGARCAATGTKPRLLAMARKLDLDAFETRVVALLVGRTISPAIKALMDGMEASAVQRIGDDSTTVGALLSIFCPDSFADQVAHRAHFYKGARLIARGVVRVTRSRWHSSGSTDLTECRVELDRRVLDFVVGLNTEINELVEGSELYSPKVSFDDLVLPGPHKEKLIALCSAYDAFTAAYVAPAATAAPSVSSDAQQQPVTGWRAWSSKRDDATSLLPYGAGLIILLTGPSGTGKTMTVHAVANQLKKRVLQVDFQSLRGKQASSDDVDADLRGLFREAEMADAIIFFDECEAMFRSRDISGGGDRLLRALLQEIEKHAGIVFLATNRPAEIDDALHRRISIVLEYTAPNAAQRRAIWATLTKKIATGPIDWDAISLKYELAGGFLKNALLSALLFAIHRDNTTEPVVTEGDIRAGCALQQRGVMHKHGTSLGERDRFLDGAAPKLDALALHKNTRKTLDAIVAFEKKRGVVFGTWGFGRGDTASGAASSDAATLVLVYGPRGAGKRTVCAGLASTLASSLYRVAARDVVAFQDSLGSSHPDASPEAKVKRLDAIVDDARLTDSVLLVDGFEHALAQADGLAALSPALARTLDRLAKFPGLVLLVAHLEDPNTLTFAPDFLRRLTSAVALAKPEPVTRANIWRAIIPAAAPLAEDVRFEKLGSDFDLLPTSIRRAAVNAAAVAAAEQATHLSHRHFATAARAEVERLKGLNADALDRLFM